MSNRTSSTENRYAREPGLESARIAQLFDMSKRLGEDFMEQVLDLGVLAQNSHKKSLDVLAICVKERRRAPGVTGEQGVDQGGVIVKEVPPNDIVPLRS